ncbi:DUF2089 family protein [Pelotomaculum sp. PtaB.Bin117]|uniref:DUF2089 family protein n=1 Tax=Pelotomaculum sp. PtaB.Bin117 TaxID=1811694 RepID=UPI0009C4E184|nr:DUF2089 family protein [Pelotomaculum sp. PtaB.Bin117]OPX85750.1 MAG: hypothetical protein A4E54_02242 [Pelotomaculum sp. PtaB.Bin117]
MEKEFLGCCPRCNEKLIATQLVCKSCDLKLNADFNLSNFDYLDKEQLDFVESFLKCQGSFKALQEEKGMSYPAAKKKLLDILIKLGWEGNKTIEEDVFLMSIPTTVPILETDDLIIKRIKQKLNQSSGRATIKLFQGDPCKIWYSSSGNGLDSSKIPIPSQLTWEAFIAAVELVIKKGGKAEKGNARAGKLGSERLPFDSVEGFIAHKVHGVKEGESAFGPGFVICAVLDWAEICKNERGYLSICPMFLSEYKESR